jgi:hypothetical protein
VLVRKFAEASIEYCLASRLEKSSEMAEIMMLPTISRMAMANAGMPK